MTTPQQDVDALLGELDAEFGKKSKVKSDIQIARERNRAWHDKNVPADKGATSFARAQLERSAFRNWYDWETQRMRFLEEGAEAQDDLEWYPEAQVTFVIRQRCSTCGNCTEFTGNEFIRFRGRKRKFLLLGGEMKDISPTVLRQVADCDPNLIAFGLPDGSVLEDLVEEIDETVRRCPGCIMVEHKALEMWKVIEAQASGQTPAQGDLAGFDEAMKEVER